MEGLWNLVLSYYESGPALAKYHTRATIGLLPWEVSVVRSHMNRRGRVLVVGCGGGRESFALSDLGYQVTGIDTSLGQVESARRAAVSLGCSTVEFRRCDGVHLPFDARTFDYVAMWNQVLANVPGSVNRLTLLTDARRVLKPMGTLSLSVHDSAVCYRIACQEGLIVRDAPDPDLEEGDLVARETKGSESSCYWHYFTADELREAVEAAGLDVLVCEPATRLGQPQGWETIRVCVAKGMS